MNNAARKQEKWSQKTLIWNGVCCAQDERWKKPSPNWQLPISARSKWKRPFASKSTKRARCFARQRPTWIRVPKRTSAKSEFKWYCPVSSRAKVYKFSSLVYFSVCKLYGVVNMNFLSFVSRFSSVSFFLYFVRIRMQYFSDVYVYFCSYCIIQGLNKF